MNIKRIGAPVAGVAAAALALAGCTTTTPDPGNTGGSTSAPPAAGATVTIAEVNELTSFQTGTADGNVDINNQIDYFTKGAFFYLDPAAAVVYDESFGTVEQVSEDPLVVKYTVNEGVVWSDGEAFDADDMVLAWAAASGYYDGAGEGGVKYFSPAGSTAGLDQTSYPEIGDDGRSITLTFSGPYADWTLFQPTGVPAHVVASNASIDGSLLDVFEAATPGEENAELREVATFWNTGFDAASLPDDPALYLATGPFIVSEWSPGQSVTLVKNERYTGDHSPEGIDKIVVRFIADGPAQVAALQNQEVDIINPQASSDLLATLEGLSGVNILTGPTGSYDHLDLNHNPSGVFADANVREAFLKTVPRDQLVDALIRTIDPEAPLLNSQIFFPGVEGYAEAEAVNGLSAFVDPDIEGAKALLAGATPTVRIAYNKDNPNRLDAFLAIQASAAQAGFNVVDGGLAGDVWGGALTQPDTWDAFIFGWSTVGAGVGGVPQLFKSTSDSNFGKFNSPEADALMDQLVRSVDPAEQVQLQVQIDEILGKGFFGLPMYVLPGVFANSERINGIEYNTWQTGPIWNFWEWTVSE